MEGVGLAQLLGGLTTVVVAEMPEAGLCVGLLALGGSGGLVLGAMRPDAMDTLGSIVWISLVASDRLLGMA